MLISLVWNGISYENFAIEDLLARGVPQVVIDEARQSQRIEQAKSACRTMIYRIASIEQQINLTFALTLIASKSASARTPEQTAMLAAAPDVLDFVDAMKAAIPGLAAQPDADLYDPANWPAPPASVTDLVAQF